jgi:hypothetical protein
MEMKKTIKNLGIVGIHAEIRSGDLPGYRNVSLLGYVFQCGTVCTVMSHLV